MFAKKSFSACIRRPISCDGMNLSSVDRSENSEVKSGHVTRIKQQGSSALYRPLDYGIRLMGLG
jgi:hypothetical protein